MRIRFSASRAVALVGAAALVVGVVANVPTASAAPQGTGLGFVLTDDGNGGCTHPEPTSCHFFANKTDVYLHANSADDGTYFFAVLTPGGQSDPNDGTPKNLSSPNDTYVAREFTVSGGVITASGHPQDVAGDVQLMTFNDTGNPSNVYDVAICSAADIPVTPSDCQYLEFKVDSSGQVAPASDLTVTKSADGAYDDTFSWGITKDVDKHLVEQVGGGTATFNYTVTVTKDSGTVSAVTVSGTISVFNPNLDASLNALPITGVDVTDELSDTTVCTVTNGADQTLTTVQTDFDYTCSLNALPQAQLDNTVTVTWPDQFLDDGSFLTGSFADFTFSDINFEATLINDCAAVSDTLKGSLGITCATHAYQYPLSLAVPVNGCTDYTNTASFTTDTAITPNSASQTVTTCGPAKTGALTMGFWKQTNGQNLIGTYCVNGSNTLSAYLKGLGAGSGPFANAPTSCKDLASFVNTILKAASATNMNLMLKAQMLATALDVWFSGPGWSGTTVNKVKPPSSFLSHNSLGTFNMDLTAICPMVDNVTAGSATCTSSTPSSNGVAGGAFPTSPMSMQALLDYEATTPAPFNGSTSSPVWYAGNRTKEELAKNAFDQFNNQLAFGSF